MDAQVTDKMILEEATGERVELPCRWIRVGSYKSMPKERAVFTEKGIHLKVPDICSGTLKTSFCNMLHLDYI